MTKLLLPLSLIANVVLIGICAVALLSSEKSSPVAVTSEEAAAADSISARIPEDPPSPEKQTVDRESLPSSKEIAPQTPEPTADFGLLLAELEAMDLKIVPAGLVQELDIRALNPDGSLSDEVQKLFVLGEEERERLDEILGTTADRLRELEMENAEVISLAENKVQFRIPPLAPELAESLGANLRQDLEATLGEVDGSLLWDLMRGRHNREFWSGFGEKGIDVTLTFEEASDDRIDLKYEQKPYNGLGYFMTETTAPPGGFGGFMDQHLWRRSYLSEYLPERLKSKILTSPSKVEP